MRITSLRRRLFLVGAAGLLPLAVASGFTLLALVDYQKQQAAQSGIEITRGLSIAVDGELQRNVAALQALAADPRLTAGDFPRHRELRERAVAARPDWTDAILHDARGRMGDEHEPAVVPVKNGLRTAGRNLQRVHPGLGAQVGGESPADEHKGGIDVLCSLSISATRQ